MNVYLWSGNIRDGSVANNASAVIVADRPDQFDTLIETYWHQKVLQERNDLLTHWHNPDPDLSPETRAAYQETAERYTSLGTYWQEVHGSEEVIRWQGLIRATLPTTVVRSYTSDTAHVVVLAVGVRH